MEELHSGSDGWENKSMLEYAGLFESDDILDCYNRFL